jgi:hypothetical protein
VWVRLTQLLEGSSIFNNARRTRAQFVVKGTVSAPVTFEVNAPEVTAATHSLAKLLIAFNDSGLIDVRQI